VRYLSQQRPPPTTWYYCRVNLAADKNRIISSVLVVAVLAAALVPLGFLFSSGTVTTYIDPAHRFSFQLPARMTARSRRCDTRPPQTGFPQKCEGRLYFYLRGQVFPATSFLFFELDSFFSKSEYRVVHTLFCKLLRAAKATP